MFLFKGKSLSVGNLLLYFIDLFFLFSLPPESLISRRSQQCWGAVEHTPCCVAPWSYCIIGAGPWGD